MTMGKDNGGQVITIFFEKVEIGNRDIDAKRCFLREAHARIDNDHLAAVSDAHTVHPEFADAAERNYFYLIHFYGGWAELSQKRSISGFKLCFTKLSIYLLGKVIFAEAIY